MNVYIYTSGIAKELKNAYIGHREETYEKTYTYDFQNDGDLGWTGHAVGYGTPNYVSGQGWTIGSTSGGYQGGILPPNSVYKGELKRIRVYWYKPQGAIRYSAVAAGIANDTEVKCIEYGRNHSYSSGGWLGVDGNWQSVVELTGEIFMDVQFQDDGYSTITLSNNGLNTNTYSGGAIAASYKQLWQDKNLGLMMARWDGQTHYIRKVEITVKEL